jgi:16S rRNA processing protein RimM
VDRNRVVVAEILRPRGLRGELVARSQTDVPGRFEQLEEANAHLKNGSDVPVQIAAARQYKGDWVLKFAGVDTIEAAEVFRGADLWVRLENRGRLEGDQLFRSDLIGCRVLDSSTGVEVGVVESWQQYGGAVPLMEVRLAKTGQERLIPFVPSMCEVDLAARVIRATLPEGLLDL